MRRNQKDTRIAVLFLLPFLTVYSIFLIYPLIKGFWISLNDWHLMKVAFDPSAREFVGLKNYIRIFWGKEMEWAALAHPRLQIGAVISFLVAWAAFWQGRISTGTLVSIAAVVALAYFAFGWAPGEDGRWYTRRFWPAVGNTIAFVVWTVPSVTLVSLVLAVILNREDRAAAIFRTIFFLTTVLSVTVATLIWKLMLSPHLGLLAELQTRMGFDPIAWVSREGYAMAALVIVTVWWGVGISMMLFLAGLQEISDEIYDAAKIDGIGRVRTFVSITLPNMTRTITLVAVLQIIAHFQVFGQVHLLTAGGPGDSTQVLVRLIYETGFRDNQLGRATAMSVFLLVVMMVFSVIQLMIGRKVAQ